MTRFDFIQIDGSLIYRFPNNLSVTPTPVHTNHHALQYEHEVSAILIQIRRRLTGRMLLDVLKTAGRGLTIVPTNSATNAGATPMSGTGAVAARQQVLVGDNGQVVRDRAGNALIRTGLGSDVGLLFTPRSINPEQARTVPPGAQADEVLVHELVHTLRQMHGGQTNRPTGSAFGNIDEFMAIVVADMYSSETWTDAGGRQQGGLARLRASHDLNPASLASVLRSTMCDTPDILRGTGPTLSATFATRFGALLEEFRLGETLLFHRLAGVQAHFNPLTEHLVNRGLLRRPAQAH